MLYWDWDDEWLMVANYKVDDVVARLESAGLVRGDDFLVRHPGWHRVEGRRKRLGIVTAFLFTGDCGGLVMARMILE